MLADLLSSRLAGAWRVQALNVSAFCGTFRAQAAQQAPLFVKSLPAERAAVLHAEADGLAALAATQTVQVPRTVACFEDGGLAVLALQWLDVAPSASASAVFAERLGHALAALHLATPPGDGRFGWRRDNWLGATPQGNAWSLASGRDGWIAFLAERRLLPLAAGLGEPLGAAVRRVIDVLPRLFDDGHVPRPSLIHGDLWSGNWAALAGGEPVIFDPVVSVSDAEAELAMMELFGAPPAPFWAAYREAMPVAPGYARRRPVYQLVHLLNHARLFGGGYRQQALSVAQALAGTGAQSARR